MANILLINQGHTSNIGDKAINFTIKRYLESSGHHVICESFDTSINSVPYKLLGRVTLLLDVYNRARISRTVRQHLQHGIIDCAVIGGGELLLGDHRFFNSSFLQWGNILAKNKIPYFVYGVSGNEPTNSGLGLKHIFSRYSQALNQANAICVRDAATQNLLCDKYHIQSVCFPDCVFSFSNIEGCCSRIYSKEYSTCVPVPYSKFFSTTLKVQSELHYWQTLIDIMIKVDKQWIITTTEPNDFDYICKFAKYASQYIPVDVIKCNSLDDFTNIAQRSRYMFSGRMHACIIAMQYGCENIVIPFKDKLKFFQIEYQHTRVLSKIQDQALQGMKWLDEQIRCISMK